MVKGECNDSTISSCLEGARQMPSTDSAQLENFCQSVIFCFLVMLRCYATLLCYYCYYAIPLFPPGMPSRNFACTVSLS